MKFKLIVQMDNAAFDPRPEFELGRILKELANTVETDYDLAPRDKIKVRDINGNTVGEARVTR